MKAQHTPGPWKIQASSHKGNGSAWRDIVSTGAEFSPSYVGEAIEQDAHLIAAAPDMLAALESMYSAWPVEHSPQGALLANARAAIAKARGE